MNSGKYLGIVLHFEDVISSLSRLQQILSNEPAIIFNFIKKGLTSIVELAKTDIYNSGVQIKKSHDDYLHYYNEEHIHLQYIMTETFHKLNRFATMLFICIYIIHIN